MAATFAGLEFLATAVVVLDERYVVRYANQSAENLLGTAAKSLIGQPFLPFFPGDTALETALADALVTHWDYSAQNVTYARPGREPLPLCSQQGCTRPQRSHDGPQKCWKHGG